MCLLEDYRSYFVVVCMCVNNVVPIPKHHPMKTFTEVNLKLYEFVTIIIIIIMNIIKV
jgi:hypothetical protein